VTPEDLRRHLEPLLHSWAGGYLESVTVCGSHAKGTALPNSDVDLFLSLSPAMPGPLSGIHTSLAAHFRDYSPQPRNVSVRITIDGFTVDLVPGRRREDSTAHTLWQVRHNTWLQTDIAEQIRYVRSSGLLNEILALKI
jgi:tRNA nucleotidyltransferase (CCA-adding enzyme)